MGRAPCCDKTNVKRGPWSPEEDAKLKAYMEQHGTGGNWIALPQKIGLKRCGKSCRLRWLNYLRPNLRHGSFSEEEDNIICSLYVNIGSRWSIIAAQLPGRTDNDIKNYWNTKLKKKLLVKQRNNFKEQHEAQLARHIFSLTTQDHIKSTESEQNLVLPVISQSPYNWPTTESEHNSFPISSALQANAGSIQHYNYLNNNQTSSSLRNLAPKLEGVKLSDEQPYTNMNYSQYSTCDISFPQDQIYSSSTMNMITPAGMVSTSTCGFGNYFPNDHLDLSELNSCVNQQQQIDGSIIMRVASGSTNSITSTESSTSTWGDISSLVYDYQGHCQQRIPDQDVLTFQESSRYFGMQTQ